MTLLKTICEIILAMLGATTRRTKELRQTHDWASRSKLKLNNNKCKFCKVLSIAE